MKTQDSKGKISSAAILSVAEDLFSKKGYKGTSIKDISKKLKVSKPALYYYFNSKMEILKNLHSMAFEQLLSSFEETLNHNSTPDERFKVLIENQVKVVAKNAKLVKIFFGDYKEFPEKAKHEIREKRRIYTEKWIELYKEGIRAGLFQNIDPKLSVYVIMGACNWIQMWYSRSEEIRENELAKIVYDLLSVGYLTTTSKNKEGELRKLDVRTSELI